MYKRQAFISGVIGFPGNGRIYIQYPVIPGKISGNVFTVTTQFIICLLYTSDAADERSSVDLGGRRIIKNKNTIKASTVLTKSDELEETKIRTHETK